MGAGGIGRRVAAATLTGQSRMVVARPSALPIGAFRVGYAGPAASIEANVPATGIVGAPGSACKRRRGLACLAVMAVPRPSTTRADAAIAQPRLALFVRFAFVAVWQVSGVHGHAPAANTEFRRAIAIGVAVSVAAGSRVGTGAWWGGTGWARGFRRTDADLLGGRVRRQRRRVSIGGIGAEGEASADATAPRQSNHVLAPAPALPIHAFLVGYARPAAAIEAKEPATFVFGSTGSLCKRHQRLAGFADAVLPPSNICANVAIAQPRLALSVRVACAAVGYIPRAQGAAEAFITEQGGAIRVGFAGHRRAVFALRRWTQAAWGGAERAGGFRRTDAALCAGRISSIALRTWGYLRRRRCR